ncbi:MAG: hypothetical protein KJ069_22980 [Anaerolineae bacterium]|nr:hypothetical protein [Anaerolineae bacterium]
MRNTQTLPYPLLVSLLLLLLAACTTPAASGRGAPGDMPALPDPAVQATLGARQAQDAAATYDAALAATQQVIQATENARSQATGTAAAVATGKAVAATSTAADLSARGTQIALVATETGHAIANAATVTHQAAAVQAEMTAQAIHMGNAQMLQEAERQRLAAQQQRQETINAALPYLLAAVALAVVILVGLFAFLMVRSRNPVFHVEHLGTKIAIVPTANGSYAPLPGLPALSGNHVATRALPATTLSGPSVVTPSTITAMPQRSPRASWQMFMRHQDPATVPLGVNEATGQPVFLNRLHNPHLLIAGTTGAGKTTAGLAPFVAGNWGNQAHVVVINGRGSDFAPFAGQPNLTLWPSLRPLALLHPLADFLSALVEEMYRRDGVLARTGASSWAQLPAQAGESGELLIAIDEFLTIVGAAREAAELARLASDPETAKNLAYQATLLWLRLLTLTNEGRKYGLYLAVTMTDPTREAIGDHGMRLRRQMATIGFRMNSPASSRAFLDVSGADGLASGSAGLANGRFVYNISGMVGTAVGFFPDPADLYHFFDARPVTPHPLPEALAATVAALPPQADMAAPTHPAEAVYPPYPSLLHTPPGLISQAARDGQALRPYLAGLKSLNAAGSLLNDVSGRPSGQFLQERLKPALVWLHETENNPDAVRLLARFSE